MHTKLWSTKHETTTIEQNVSFKDHGHNQAHLSATKNMRFVRRCLPMLTLLTDNSLPQISCSSVVFSPKLALIQHSAITQRDVASSAPQMRQETRSARSNLPPLSCSWSGRPRGGTAVRLKMSTRQTSYSGGCLVTGLFELTKPWKC